jgi:iron-sulfur cluster repair protein YtfE (RIC family)
MDEIIQHVIQVAGVALAGLLTAVLVRLFKKFGIDLDAQKQAQLEYYAKQAVLRVEELAAQQLRKYQQSLTSEAKLSKAVSDVVEHVPRATREQAADAVHAALPQVGLGAATMVNAGDAAAAAAVGGV